MEKPPIAVPHEPAATELRNTSHARLGRSLSLDQDGRDRLPGLVQFVHLLATVVLWCVFLLPATAESATNITAAATTTTMAAAAAARAAKAAAVSTFATVAASSLHGLVFRFGQLMALEV